MIFNSQLSQIAVMISAVVVKKSQFEFLPKYVFLPKYDFRPQYESTWASTIAFSVVGIVISLIIFIFYLFKMPKRYDFELTMNNFVSLFNIFLRNINFTSITFCIQIIISDAILGAALFILGITCAFNEYDLKKLKGIGIYVNIGAFGSAGVI